VGLSLNPDGSEDAELKIKDLPGIQVGDWRLPTSSATNLETIPEDEIEESIEVEDDGYLYTAEEVANGINNLEFDEDIVTTDTDSYTDYDLDSDIYDDEVNGDAEDMDMNMD
jgi:hypothetical protein